MTQLEFPTGEQLRDHGTKRVMSHNCGWVDKFNEFAEYILRINGSVTSEQVVDRIGLPDGHPSCVGAAMRAFAKANRLRKTGYIPSTKHSCRCAVIAVWSRIQ